VKKGLICKCLKIAFTLNINVRYTETRAFITPKRGRFRLYADAFVLRAERERKHGETEKEERLDHLHCGKTVCDVMLFYYLPVEMRSV